MSSVGIEGFRKVSLPGEHLFKLLIVGNSKCGKSSLVARYTSDQFSAAYNTTIGSDFSRKQVQWDAHTHVRVNLWYADILYSV
jgi:GTPase SAR1 family protein